MTINFDPLTSTYTSLGSSRKDAGRETTWQMVRETGAIDEQPRSLTEIARACGLVTGDERLTGGKRRQLTDALNGRPDVGRADEMRRGQKTTMYRLLDGAR